VTQQQRVDEDRELETLLGEVRLDLERLRDVVDRRCGARAGCERAEERRGGRESAG